MIKKVINKKVPLAVLRDAQVKVDEVMGMLAPYCTAQSSPEREAMIRKGPEFFKFMELSCRLAVENSDLISGFTESAVLGKDCSIVRELWIFIAKLNQLKNNIYDMEIAAGSPVLQAALAFYQTVKIAARRDIPGARLIYEELKPTRPSGRRKQQRIKNSRIARID